MALVVLIVLAKGRPHHLASYTVYGLSMVGLYLASALYHSLYKHESLFQKLDHIGIYALIAGTYTPVCLVALRGTFGTAMLVAQWSMAAIGMAAILIGRSPHWLRITLYLAMGWLAVVAIPTLGVVLPRPAVWLLVGGGIAYTVGTIIFVSERPRLWPGKFGSHDLWHVFVLAGSACHFVMMLFIVRLP